MPLVSLTDTHDRRLEPYRTLKLSSESRRARLFVVEGDKLVERLLHSHLRVHSVLAGQRFLASRALSVPDQVTLFVIPDELIPELVGFKFHRGILACGYRGTEPSLSEVLSARTTEQPATEPFRMTIVVGVDIHDPTNLGSILRTADSFGATAAVLGGHCADPYSRRVLRVSMGAPFQLPVVHSKDLAADLTMLRDSWGASLIAAVADSAAQPLDRVHRVDRLAILLGNERHGLSQQWTALCDQRVTISMEPGADSLNVAVATGILLYHLCGPRAAPA
jgi:tRNA G18 (ribose-2'-O)-methylase SpoU